jgi:hypothetical protein
MHVRCSRISILKCNQRLLLYTLVYSFLICGLWRNPSLTLTRTKSQYPRYTAKSHRLMRRLYVLWRASASFYSKPSPFGWAFIRAEKMCPWKILPSQLFTRHAVPYLFLSLLNLQAAYYIDIRVIKLHTTRPCTKSVSQFVHPAMHDACIVK